MASQHVKREKSRLVEGAGTGADSSAYRLNPKIIAPRRGWRGAGSGRSAHTDRGAVYLGTTSQVGGLFPFVHASGLPPEGVPIGTDLLTKEQVCFDPAGWVGKLTQNPGVWIMAQPGSGKSALAKRIANVYMAYGFKALVPADPKAEYTPIVEAVGGQVVRIGRGLDRINPLDSGPLRGRLHGLPREQAEALRMEITGRRSELLTALLSTPDGLTGRRPTAPESNALSFVLRLIGERQQSDPIIPDVVRVLREGPAELQAQLLVNSPQEYNRLIRDLATALENLCSGPLSGMFDGPTTRPLDLDAPALSLDLSALLTAGPSTIAAGMLASWSYSYGQIDAARALGMMHQPIVALLDEMWRALRAGSGLVDAMDSMTRLNRTLNEVTIMITHSLLDPESLPTPEDRAKARGLMERCDSLILGALPVSELERVNARRPLTEEEQALVASWASPTLTGLDGTSQEHPGRGKYLIKIGGRFGVPVSMQLTDSERKAYWTDPRMSRKGEGQE